MNIEPNRRRITHYALRIAPLALFLVLIFASVTSVFAQSSRPTDDEVNAIARKLYCPVCESTPLDVCPTDACKEWREQIRTMLSEGKSEEEILKAFEVQYGARVLSEPPRQGFYWLVYVIPPLIILVGAIILFRSMREWTRKPELTESDSPSLADEADYLARIEEELKKQK